MNISEFARLAGVSKSAVSRYFNNGYLSEGKRAQIEEAIRETGYSPNISAQNVRNRVTKLVGVILPKLSSESCARITEGISQVLAEEDYDILLVNTANDCNKEIKYLELFRQNRVDGVILLASVFTDLHRRILKKMHIPVIIVGQVCKGFSSICHDDFGAARSLTGLMLKKGAKKPACIYVRLDDENAGRERFEGYKSALTDYDIPFDKSLTRQADFTIDSGYEQASRLFKGDDNPDALFCATDNIAAGAMLYCREHGIRIPEDLMIASIGDSKVGRIAYTPLTSAHLHYKTSGIEAARMMLSAIRERDSIPRTLRLDYVIMERESTNH